VRVLGLLIVCSLFFKYLGLLYSALESIRSLGFKSCNLFLLLPTARFLILNSSGVFLKRLLHYFGFCSLKKFCFSFEFLPTARSAVGFGITLCTFTPSIAPFGHLAILPFYHFDILTFQDRGSTFGTPCSVLLDAARRCSTLLDAARRCLTLLDAA
jgi:hypothetical protein